jgi:hypothetical protein
MQRQLEEIVAEKLATSCKNGGEERVKSEGAASV